MIDWTGPLLCAIAAFGFGMFCAWAWESMTRRSKELRRYYDPTDDDWWHEEFIILEEAQYDEWWSE